jgi:hypothetical protein
MYRIVATIGMTSGLSPRSAMLKLFALAVLWRTAAYRLALDVVIPTTSDRRSRVSMTNAMLAALLVTAVATVCSLLFVLPGIGLLAWLVLAAAWLGAFAFGFGLHPQALGVVFAAEIVATVLMRLAIWWLGW